MYFVPSDPSFSSSLLSTHVYASLASFMFCRRTTAAGGLHALRRGLMTHCGSYHENLKRKLTASLSRPVSKPGHASCNFFHPVSCSRSLFDWAFNCTFIPSPSKSQLHKRDLEALDALPTQLITGYRRYYVQRKHVQIRVAIQLVHVKACSLLPLLHKALVVRSQKSLNIHANY